ncbi:MAG: tetratricopeptide repeat protein [Deltaproteobacteria bacterium]|nr:tetratricopeptide repeat protein [Deltaproteobacteria bacterium]
MLLKHKKVLAAEVCAVCAAMVLFASAALAASNVPSIDEVYQAARNGHLTHAEAMTNEVLHAYPNSARAHYVMAQILAAEGRNTEARTYLAEAERLKPGLPFASPQSVANLERRINGEAHAPVTQSGTNQGFHWWWLLVGGILFFILLRALRGRRPASSGYSGSTMSGGGVGPAPGMPPAGYSGWGGGGLLSSVLAGLGFGAGAAAGERAVDRFLGREDRGGSAQPEIMEPPSSSGDLGGNDFGVQPGDNSSGGWDDSGDQTNASPGPNDDFGPSGSGDGGWDDSSGGGGDVNV